MAILSQNLVIDRCPHCAVANPNLFRQHQMETVDHAGHNKRLWAWYTCGRCGKVVTAWADGSNQVVREYFPQSRSVDEEIPERPREFLSQALASLHAPAGAVMLAASAIDSMLRLKGYSNGSLYSRIEEAVRDHVITADMAKWAHDVRLDANDQRHADQGAALPSVADAERVIDFSAALADVLFVLPGRVQRGIKQASN